MATSIIDYVFRELAVSYLGRADLSHAEPADLMPDTVGRGHEEGDLGEWQDRPDPTRDPGIRRVASAGFLRDNLYVVKGGKHGGGHGGGEGRAAASTQPVHTARQSAVAWKRVAVTVHVGGRSSIQQIQACTRIIRTPSKQCRT